MAKRAAAKRDIVDTIEIEADPAFVLAALATDEGVRGWWTTDCEIGRTEHVVRFARSGTAMTARFKVERQSLGGIALTCIDEVNGLGWLGSRLHFALARTKSGSRVAVLHTGLPATGASYETSVDGWRFFLASLKAYVETGTGTPHPAELAA
jgi:uncharacterized protein YndB with AHSA1/START domain